MRAALRHLCEHGADALKGRKMGDRWRKAMVSNRVAADLRKKAIREGTYGSFCRETGVGWDPIWDNPGRLPNMRAPKGVEKAQKSREERAQKIEKKLETMDEQIEEHLNMLRNRKPEKNFENYYKKLMKSRKR